MMNSLRHIFFAATTILTPLNQTGDTKLATAPAITRYEILVPAVRGQTEYDRFYVPEKIAEQNPINQYRSGLTFQNTFCREGLQPANKPDKTYRDIVALCTAFIKAQQIADRAIKKANSGLNEDLRLLERAYTNDYKHHRHSQEVRDFAYDKTRRAYVILNERVRDNITADFETAAIEHFRKAFPSGIRVIPARANRITHAL